MLVNVSILLNRLVSSSSPSSSFVVCLSLSLKSSHHCDELAELDISITVLVNLLDDGVNGLHAQLVGSSEAENLANFFSRDHARVVLVKHFEGCMQFFLGSQVGLACGCDDKLSVVDKATIISVDGSEHFFDLLVRHDLTVVLKIAHLHLFHGKFAVTVRVKGLENFGKVVTLLFAH